MKHLFNRDYFSKIDTNDKAYFLGLLFADGNVHKNTTTLTLEKTDAEIIAKFKIYINYLAEIRLDREKYLRFVLCSQKIARDLISHGCVERKSLILKFPNLDSDELIRHFIRGYFDGDGSFYFGQSGAYVDIAGTNLFCQYLLEIIKLKLDIHVGIRPIKNIFRARISGTRQVMKFLNWLYYNRGDLYMERKLQKFKNYVINYKNKYQIKINDINRSNCSKLNYLDLLKNSCEILQLS